MPLFSRSVRTLIQRQPSEQRHIKDLKDLRFIVVQGAIDIKDLKALRHGEGQALALRGKMSLLCKFIPCSDNLPNWRTRLSQN